MIISLHKVRTVDLRLIRVKQYTHTLTENTHIHGIQIDVRLAKEEARLSWT